MPKRKLLEPGYYWALFSESAEPEPILVFHVENSIDPYDPALNTDVFCRFGIDQTFWFRDGNNNPIEILGRIEPPTRMAK